MERNDGRLMSLDALRGFDMLFIMGFSMVIYNLCAAFGFGKDCWLAQQMCHASWHGFRHHDTIFPLFLFIAGISFPFSLAKQRANGRTAGEIARKTLVRGLTLVLLGLVYNGLFAKGIHVRCGSVLGRIGIAWMFAAFLYQAFGTRVRVGIAAAILVGYWLLMRYVPCPGAPADADIWSRQWNLAAYVDKLLLPNAHGLDPEGLLSNVPAIVTAMLGMFTGEFVRCEKPGLTGGRKASIMLVAAALMLGLCLAWATVMPINKVLWTPPFVLAAGAYSLALFAIFYWLVDVKMWRGWTFFFRVIGMNAIAFYLLNRIVDFARVGKFFFGGLAELCPEAFQASVCAAGGVTVAWLTLLFFYKKGIFFKVG